MELIEIRNSRIMAKESSIMLTKRVLAMSVRRRMEIGFNMRDSRGST
jgi:hypothetical protein